MKLEKNNLKKAIMTSLIVGLMAFSVPKTLAFGTITFSPATLPVSGGGSSTVATLVNYCGDASEIFYYDVGDITVKSFGGVAACPTSDNPTPLGILDDSTSGVVKVAVCDGLGQTPDYPTQNNANCSDWYSLNYSLSVPPVVSDGMPTLTSGNVSVLLDSLGTAMTGIVTFFVSGAGLWLTLAAALIVVSMLRRFLSLRKS
jgi:hypothetical protein